MVFLFCIVPCSYISEHIGRLSMLVEFSVSFRNVPSWSKFIFFVFSPIISLVNVSCLLFYTFSCPFWRFKHSLNEFGSWILERVSVVTMLPLPMGWINCNPVKHSFMWKSSRKTMMKDGLHVLVTLLKCCFVLLSFSKAYFCLKLFSLLKLYVSCGIVYLFSIL